MGDKEVECSMISRDVSLKRCCFNTGSVCINDVLPHQILVEILCCLPCKSAMVCKPVCKCWRSLISTPSFISCFISRQINNKGYCQQQQHRFIKRNQYMLLISKAIPCSDIGSRFLPVSSSSNCKFRVHIRASSDDLFLCSPSASVAAPLFISSPLTKERFELPPPPPASSDDHLRPHIYGFTHKPYYYRVVESQHVLVNSSCKFRVVRMLLKQPANKMDYIRGGSEFEINIFSSETWHWTKSKMQLPSPTSLPCSAISRNGVLYWLCYKGDVIIHDPYNNKVCYVVESPSPESTTWRSRVSLGVSQGSLLGFSYYSRYGFKVWELVEDIDDPHLQQQPKWRLERSVVTLNEYIVNSSQMVQRAEWESRKGLRVFAVHPNDRNIFHLWSSLGGIRAMNLKIREFKPQFNPSKLRGPRKIMVVIKEPYWPTPISALLNPPSLDSYSQ